MNLKLKEVQKNVLRSFSRTAEDFALSGGTALELYYLHHRFSVDLDFFSPGYNVEEIERIISALQEDLSASVKLEEELIMQGRARMRFYTILAKGQIRPLKIDFVEDVISPDPDIKIFDAVRVYNAENIYLQKIIAISGISSELDEIGRRVSEGRREARDVFDVYMLSDKIKPLYIFLQGVSKQLQRRMIHWYQTFSRQELKLSLLDLDIYDNKFDSKKMIIYLESQIKRFIKEVLR